MDSARQAGPERLAERNNAVPEDVQVRNVIRNGERITIISPATRRAIAQQRADLRRAEELSERQAELQAAQAAGDEIVVSEAGTTISVDVGNRRPASWPEGGPLIRQGRWLV